MIRLKLFETATQFNCFPQGIQCPIVFCDGNLFLYLFFLTTGTLSLIFFTIAGFLIISSNSVTMAMGQSFLPQNLGMASALMLGLAMGIGGIVTTALGWVADTWGVPFTLQITFILPILAFLVCWPLPYPPPAQAAQADRAGDSQ